ncbi:hypothetical protein ABES03_12375 [Neobacillus rhizosphaerae]|uniref:hypothetical protein n=1 Tax=Neobacillus rhizosphaerae TaxID=2880965 RepID=UPI003D2A4D89
MTILPLPQKFDQNEWFILFTIIVLVCLLNKLPRRFPTSITILLLMFTISVARGVDHVIAGPHVDLYDIMDSGDFELFDLLCYVPYAPFGYVFIYLYDKFQLKGISLILYIVIFSVGSIGFEWMTGSNYISYLKYSSWKPIYSLPIYLVIQPCTILFFHLITSIHEKSLTAVE